MKLNAVNDKAKCAGQSEAGSHVCADRGRCGRYLRPAGDYQTHGDFWKAGDACQHYEIVPAQYHIKEADSGLIESDGWNDGRIEIIARNGNDGLHYDAA